MKLPVTSPLDVAMARASVRVPVGRLAMDGRIAVFEYDSAFIGSGLSLNPLWPQATVDPIAALTPRAFNGLHGVFADSLPDAWGKELTRRRCARAGVNYDALTPLDHLAFVGDRAMGALAYHPATPNDVHDTIDLDVLAKEADDVLQGRESDVLAELERLGGSSGGARPKVLVALDDAGHVLAGDADIPNGYEAWLVKFRSSADWIDIGAVEATYAAMARAAGIRMPPTRLIAAKSGPGYFATKRFDREAGARKHVISAAAVLDIAWQEPGLDYDGLLRLVRAVTRSQFEVEEMFRRMVFNVVASNQDDHAKQHSFLYDADTKRWTLSPAYDLTFSPGPGGEHYLAVAGEGRNVGLDAIRAIARDRDIKPQRRDRIIDEVIAGVSQWRALGYDGLRVTTKSMITRVIDDGIGRLTR